MEPFILSTGPLLLDQPTETDISSIAEYCQDPVFERYLTLPWPYERKDAEFFVHEYVLRGWESGSEVTWALRGPHGEFLGVIGVRASRAMVGFWLGAPHRGRGYMPLAVSTVADWAFSSRWLEQVRWEAVVGNAASLAVARKAGFRYTGVEPAIVIRRDGSRPASWQAVLHAAEDRAPKPGWPNENDGDPAG